MKDPDAEVRLTQLLANLRRTRKYGAVAEEALRRVASAACLAHRRDADALKAAKRKLHQACGAFESSDAKGLRKAWAEAAARAGPRSNPDEIQAALSPLLQSHTSMRERWPFLGRYFREIFARTGRPKRILDLGGGLTPLARPWMDLETDAHFEHWELDGHLVEIADAAQRHFGWPGQSLARDVLAEEAYPEAEVTLLLKLLPLLERARRGAALTVLRRIPAGFCVASFPTRSLSGRGKGMAETYSAFMAGLLTELGCEAERLEFENELVFVWKG